MLPLQLRPHSASSSTGDLHRRLRCLRSHLMGVGADGTTAATSQRRQGAASIGGLTTATTFSHFAPTSSTDYTAEQTDAAVPRPALTPAERLHLEINGYVVVQDVFSKAECETLVKQILAIEKALHDSPDPSNWTPHPASHMQGRTHDFFRVDNLPHLCKAFFDYCTHPRIRGFGEEACGGRVRIGQSDAHIHRGKRDFSARPQEVQERIASEGGFGFHGGYGGQFSPQVHHVDSNGLTHCAFMKCLTNLTDLNCPEDGGSKHH
jgi:hypothetical protein